MGDNDSRLTGWIEPDEAPHLAAIRELREETGPEAAGLYSLPILSGEHDDWRWASPSAALHRIDLISEESWA